ncbi:mycofactocin precursor MftA [Gryllotalpicola koreensis]|uniref:Mycofactocin n=1 Tax=Gryllotalpicola koreensis TaxID=993086 RepID=A0ABP7ZRZ6_9MICO
MSSASPAIAPESVADAADDAIIESDVLVEEVSIDGMCGVY